MISVNSNFLISFLAFSAGVWTCLQKTVNTTNKENQANCLCSSSSSSSYPPTNQTKPKPNPTMEAHARENYFIAEEKLIARGLLPSMYTITTPPPHTLIHPLTHPTSQPRSILSVGGQLVSQGLIKQLFMQPSPVSRHGWARSMPRTWAVLDQRFSLSLSLFLI